MSDVFPFPAAPWPWRHTSWTAQCVGSLSVTSTIPEWEGKGWLLTRSITSLPLRPQGTSAPGVSRDTGYICTMTANKISHKKHTCFNILWVITSYCRYIIISKQTREGCWKGEGSLCSCYRSSLMNTYTAFLYTRKSQRSKNVFRNQLLFDCYKLFAVKHFEFTPTNSNIHMTTEK